MQVASHAQKYFKHLKAFPKEKRREITLDIISAHAEATGTSQTVLSTKSESTLLRESINAEQTIAAAEGESAGYDSLDEDNDLNSIFDVGKAPTSHVMLFNAAHSGISSFAAARFGAENTPEINVVAHSGMSLANRFSMNGPLDTVASRASQLPPFAPSSNFDVGDALM
ncbi:hypothetical protein BC332_23033 [Capsicum chinense]|nr:hypothetical protein BC332_23033 [Capsicum chinense]